MQILILLWVICDTNKSSVLWGLFLATMEWSAKRDCGWEMTFRIVNSSEILPKLSGFIGCCCSRICVCLKKKKKSKNIILNIPTIPTKKILFFFCLLKSLSGFSPGWTSVLVVSDKAANAAFSDNLVGIITFTNAYPCFVWCCAYFGFEENGCQSVFHVLHVNMCWILPCLYWENRIGDCFLQCEFCQLCRML